MKWTLGLGAVFAVFVVLGAWAGSSGDQTASAVAMFETGLATFLAIHLLFCVWVWFRAQRGSGDRMVIPSAMLGSASMLLIILPRLLWPGAQRLHIVIGIVGVAIPAVVLIMQIRRRRRQRQGA